MMCSSLGQCKLSMMHWWVVESEGIDGNVGLVQVRLWWLDRRACYWAVWLSDPPRHSIVLVYVFLLFKRPLSWQQVTWRGSFRTIADSLTKLLRHGMSGRQLLRYPFPRCPSWDTTRNQNKNPKDMSSSELPTHRESSEASYLDTSLIVLQHRHYSAQCSMLAALNPIYLLISL